MPPNGGRPGLCAGSMRRASIDRTSGPQGAHLVRRAYWRRRIFAVPVHGGGGVRHARGGTSALVRPRGTATLARRPARAGRQPHVVGARLPVADARLAAEACRVTAHARPLGVARARRATRSTTARRTMPVDVATMLEAAHLLASGPVRSNAPAVHRAHGRGEGAARRVPLCGAAHRALDSVVAKRQHGLPLPRDRCERRDSRSASSTRRSDGGGPACVAEAGLTLSRIRSGRR